MSVLTLEKSKERLSRALVSWQLGAIGLLALAVVVNMVMMARITRLEQTREADAARYQAQIESLKHTRDLAVQELGDGEHRHHRRSEIPGRGYRGDGSTCGCLSEPGELSLAW